MKSIVLLILAMLPIAASSGENVCEVDHECSIDGVITIYRTPPAFTAVLERESTCIPLALPDSIYTDADRWNGKQVSIRGDALANYRSDDAVFTYSVRGRDVTAAICGASPLVIFVNEISLIE